MFYTCSFEPVSIINIFFPVGGNLTTHMGVLPANFSLNKEFYYYLLLLYIACISLLTENYLNSSAQTFYLFYRTLSQLICGSF